MTPEQRAKMVKDADDVRWDRLRFPVLIEGLPLPDETIAAEDIGNHPVHVERWLALWETCCTDMGEEPAETLEVLIDLFVPPEMKVSIFRKDGREICLYEWNSGDNWHGYMIDTATEELVGQNSDCSFVLRDDTTARVFIDRPNRDFIDYDNPPERTSIKH